MHTSAVRPLEWAYTWSRVIVCIPMNQTSDFK